MPKIDIVIPTYNRSNYLKFAIDSVLKQTCQEFDLYILDNCSNDNTREVVESFSSTKVKYIVNEANLGMVGNWNRALETGGNDFLNILHDDDILEPDFVRKVLDFYGENGEVAFLHTAAYIVDGNNMILKKHIKNYIPITSSDQFFLNYIKFGMSIICPSVVFQRSKIPENLKFEEKYAFTADVVYFLKCSSYGSVGNINEPLIRYRAHDNSTTKSMFSNFDAKIQDRINHKVFLENEIRKRSLHKYNKLANKYFNGALCADLWFLKCDHYPIHRIAPFLPKIIKTSPSIFSYYSFWKLIVRLLLPLFLLDIAREYKRNHEG